MVEIITQEEIAKFLEGRDPMERIVYLDYSYQNDYINVFYRDEQDRKCVHRDSFYPFLWATREGCQKLCGGDRAKVKELLKKYSIGCKPLRVTDETGVPVEEMQNGYTFMFKAKVPMSYSSFLQFFKDCELPVYSKDESVSSGTKKYFLTVTPQEQYLIYTGKRFFKGYDDYDQLLRMIFDLETEGLDPTRHRIESFGIRFNRPVTYKGVTKNYEVTLELKGNTKEEKDASELKLIETALKIIYTFKPDVITAHNGENFDWNFIIERCKQLGSSIEEVSSKYFEGRSIGKNTRESVLKLGGEIEHFHQTIVPNITITDSLHAVRRAQATNSNFLKADLKYATRFLKMVKKNRVYVPGGKISEISNDFSERYAFNEENGDWYVYDPNYVEPIKQKKTVVSGDTFFEVNDEGEIINLESSKDVVVIPKEKKFVIRTKNVLEDGYVLKSGHYIVERYLLDDLWECDKVESALNSADFMLCKIIPVPYSKCVTMGTAGQWKAIMMAWSYENNLAIPKPENTGAFTGGLSRLLKTGYVKRVIKLDYNSLYPSIILTWAISDDTDLMDAMLHMLLYVLTTRETHKGLKKKAEKIVEGFDKQTSIGKVLSSSEQDEYNLASKNFKVEDNRQAVFKKLGNSFFGSYGSNNGSVFPWKSLKCAERTTCTGRMSLRLMIKHFHDLGYEPIVGDSVTYDTPIIIKNNNTIDILPICDIFDDSKCSDFGNEQYRDFSDKPYLVLTREGWKKIEYVYKHKTIKKLRRIETKNGVIDCTEDHSLFNENKEEVKPSTLKRGNKLEIYETKIDYTINNDLTNKKSWLYGFFMADGSSVYCNRTQKYFSKRKNEFVIHKGKRANWKISNKSIERLSKAKEILESEFGIKCSIKNHLKSSNVYNLIVDNTEFAKLFSEIFYTSYRYKKVPYSILNANKEVKKAFLDGFCCGDGQKDTIDECIEFGQKSKVAMAGLYFILKELNYNFRCHNRSDKPEFISFRLRNIHGNLLNESYSDRKEDEVWNNKEITSKSEFVYDISANGTFINALGMICCHNTDGFNFALPEDSQFRYTEEHPYVGKGLSRETKVGKEYTGYEADVAEFNDAYMCDMHYAPNAVNKMGLGIDEVVSATINFSRKNYADYFPDKPYPDDVKMVGNTIKSKKMPEYISKFLEKGIRQLLRGHGQAFLESYYDYIDKIYNYRIPLQDIASKGKVKKSIKEYIDDCNTITKAGRPKSRQAWMELAVKENLKVDLGDTLYYINIGKTKSQADVKKVTRYKERGENGDVDITALIEKEWKTEKAKEWRDKSQMISQLHPNARKEEEIVLNSLLVPREVIESDEEVFCDDNTEYNVPKYIDQFNKRITPLLVCFSKEIRDKILVTNPSDRRVFTKEESELVSGEPNKPGDQDTYEQLMTMEDKEIKFWSTYPEFKIPYLEECGMNWDEIYADYVERKRKEKELGVDFIRQQYDEIISNMSDSDVEDFTDGVLPSDLDKIIELEPETGNFISKQYPDVIIGSIHDIFEKVEMNYD